MPTKKTATDGHDELPLSYFACPNSDCPDSNNFDAGNLSVAERMGKNKAIRRLRCKTCGTRFSEREGSLMRACPGCGTDYQMSGPWLLHGCDS